MRKSPTLLRPNFMNALWTISTQSPNALANLTEDGNSAERVRSFGRFQRFRRTWSMRVGHFGRFWRFGRTWLKRVRSFGRFQLFQHFTHLTFFLLHPNNATPSCVSPLTNPQADSLGTFNLNLTIWQASRFFLFSAVKSSKKCNTSRIFVTCKRRPASHPKTHPLARDSECSFRWVSEGMIMNEWMNESINQSIFPSIFSQIMLLWHACLCFFPGRTVLTLTLAVTN